MSNLAEFTAYFLGDSLGLQLSIMLAILVTRYIRDLLTYRKEVKQ